MVKKYVLVYKSFCEVHTCSELKSRGFRATSLSTYDFSTLYTTLGADHLIFWRLGCISPKIILFLVLQEKNHMVLKVVKNTTWPQKQ